MKSLWPTRPLIWRKKRYEELISLVLNNNYVKENGVFILEHQSRMKLQHPNLLDTRKYGNVSFSFFKPNEKENESLEEERM